MNDSRVKLCWAHYKERGDKLEKELDYIDSFIHAKIMKGIKITSKQYCDACNSKKGKRG